jgi:hypothetical protein
MSARHILLTWHILLTGPPALKYLSYTKYRCINVYLGGLSAGAPQLKWSGHPRAAQEGGVSQTALAGHAAAAAGIMHAPMVWLYHCTVQFAVEGHDGSSGQWENTTPAQKARRANVRCSIVMARPGRPAGRLAE